MATNSGRWKSNWLTGGRTGEKEVKLIDARCRSLSFLLLLFLLLLLFYWSKIELPAFTIQMRTQTMMNRIVSTEQNCEQKNGDEKKKCELLLWLLFSRFLTKNWEELSSVWANIFIKPHSSADLTHYYYWNHLGF